MGKDRDGKPSVPLLFRLDPTKRYSDDDLLGIDYWGITAHNAGGLLRTDDHANRMPIQVKSSWCGAQEFMRGVEDRWRRCGPYYPEKLKVLLLNGQRTPPDILTDFGFALLEHAKLPRDPDNRLVLSLLNQCLSPTVVSRMFEQMRSLIRVGCIYEYPGSHKDTNPPIQGTVVILPLSDPKKRRRR